MKYEIGIIPVLSIVLHEIDKRLFKVDLYQTLPCAGAHPQGVLVDGVGKVVGALQLHVTFTVEIIHKVDSFNL